MYGLLPERPRQVDMHAYASDLRQNLDTAYARARQYIGLAQKRQKELFDKKMNFKPLRVGELVWLLDSGRMTGKLYRPWTGPFRVLQTIGMVNYKVQSVERPSMVMVVHYDRLKRCHQRQEHQRETLNTVEFESTRPDRPQRHRRPPMDFENFVETG
uniref:Integrase zinc-binding domain-containing protein n=1 Tax=Trichuris muris TaxID=70415 RepID=A0A5S6QTL4_TRIMR